MKKIAIYSLLVSSLFVTSCSDDYLDTKPQSTINEEQLATSPAGLQALLDGIYTGFRTFGNTNGGNHEDYGHKSILAGLDMMSNDNVMTKSSWYSSWYNYTGIIQTNSRSLLPWNTYYLQIKSTNTIINTITKVGVNDQNKSVLGQAYALRALSYFMLARIYGPTYVGHTSDLCVPIYTTVGFEGKSRSSVGEVYSLIESDLLKSVDLLTGYTRPNREKVDKSVAQGFLAQVSLEMGKYSQAAQNANAAKQGYALGTEADWRNGFYDLTKTTDAMWGAVITGDNTSFVASFFAHFDNTNNSGYAGGLGIYKLIDKRLYDNISATDYRKKAFVAPGGNPSYPALPAYANLKFIDPTVTDGDYIYLRASEMYYIEAEALARSGNEPQAKAVLAQITQARDASYTTSTNTGAALITEITTQKRIEMWGEGCAWFDMKRLGVGLNRVYTGTNHPTFGQLTYPANSNKFLWQIPQAEIDTNPNIVQNPN
ncbi:RagB/SusD family nutrient uptake outer membrane protein [Chryseobacterium sp. PTM-20240506]|uniref:RagB/SusD family nutrient uptake outer membrane protein n=1 Tax=unclassified Chryseobacterium TaxID=2593645 RepID=UPI002796C405|nr:RagB/SusD family nutrient uptake outer membrane protein [Chryseobacterium sp. CKR4-1]MDQ1804850.1 RagB/SusD family nutrient uptake outer membrane protein [Chryseobacterium sp. CKR4-1]